MKKEILVLLAIIAGFALIQTVKLGSWSQGGTGSMMTSADDTTFDEIIYESGDWVLVKFWAPWCGACRRLMPTVKSLAARNEDTLALVAVNVDEAPGIAQSYGVGSIPCLVLLYHGQEVDRKVGGHPEAVLQTWIDGHQSSRPAATP